MRNRRIRKPFRPSRACPHRWCKLMHKVSFLPFPVVFIASLVQNTMVVAVIVLFSFLLAMVIMTSKLGGPGMESRVTHETAGQGGAADTHVEVDRRWAILAIITDIYFAMMGITALISIGLQGNAAFKPDNKGLPPDLGWILLYTSAILLFNRYAHWRATRPRPRRRVRVWIRSVVPAQSKI